MSRRWLLIQALFTLSGGAALAYEIVWGRWLATVLGASTTASSVTLGCYMGGLAGGAWLFGRVSTRVRSPLLVYAGIEVLIAALALTFPHVAAVTIGLPGTARVAVAVVILLAPTFLMGGTLPLVVAWTELEALPAGRALGRLYGLNTLGAAVGCMLGGFVLIPRLGLEAANACAAACNVAIAIAVLLLQRGASSGPTPAPEPPDSRDAAPEPLALHALAFISGAVTLGLEVIWIRLLRITLGSTTYTFTLVVTTFILGLGIGGLTAARVADGAPIRRLLARSQLLLVYLLGMGFVVLPLAPAALASLHQVVNPTGAALGGTTVLCVLFLLPATLVIGFIFPLLGRLYMARGRRGTEVGLLYTVNTLGAVLAALATTFVLIPLMGTAGSFLLLLALAAIALGIYGRMAKRSVSRPFWTAASGAIVLLGLLVVVRPGWSAENLGYGVGWTTIFDDNRPLFFAEGSASTVVVEEARGGRTLRIDGKPVASTFYQDLSNELLLGHLPALLTPTVRTGLCVGLGTGITLDALAQHDLAELDLVELEPLVAVAAGRYFGDHNHHVLERPELTVHIDDGFNFLHATEKRYDVITSDPIQPFFRGAATLYSTEFFTRARERLSPRGVMAHWLPLGNLSLEDFIMVVRTFTDVFPHARLYWTGGGPDAVLVGRNVPWESPSIVAEQYRHAAASLSTVYLAGVDDVASLLIADRAVLRTWAGEDGVRNTIDRPRLEFSAAHSLYADTVIANLDHLLTLRGVAPRPGPAWWGTSVVLAYRSQFEERHDSPLIRRFLQQAVRCDADQLHRCVLVQRSGLLRRLLWRRALAAGDRAINRYLEGQWLQQSWWYGAAVAADEQCEHPDIDLGVSSYRQAHHLTSSSIASEHERLLQRLGQLRQKLPSSCAEHPGMLDLVQELTAP